MDDPRYEHDCDLDNGCVYVGQLGNDDIWFHDHGDRTEVILRHSSDPPDYGCWTTSMNYIMVPESYEKAIAMVVQHKASV